MSFGNRFLGVLTCGVIVLSGACSNSPSKDESDSGADLGASDLGDGQIDAAAKYGYNGDPASVEGCKASERMLDDCRRENPNITNWEEGQLDELLVQCESDELTETFGSKMLTYRDRWAYWVECQFEEPQAVCEFIYAVPSAVPGNSFQSCIWRAEELLCEADPEITDCPRDCQEFEGEYVCNTLNN